MKVALVLALVGCRSVTVMEPIAVADVRSRTQHLATERGTPLQASGVLPDHTTWGMNTDVGHLADACQHPRRSRTPCLLDDPTVTWQVTTGTRRVPDGNKVLRGMLAVGLVGALAYGNYECFGPGCSTGAKVAVGLADGVIVLGTAALAAAFFILATHVD